MTQSVKVKQSLEISQGGADKGRFVIMKLFLQIVKQLKACRLVCDGLTVSNRIQLHCGNQLS